jgi:hypothetical protein
LCHPGGRCSRHKPPGRPRAGRDMLASLFARLRPTWMLVGRGPYLAGRRAMTCARRGQPQAGEALSQVRGLQGAARDNMRRRGLHRAGAGSPSRRLIIAERNWKTRNSWRPPEMVARRRRKSRVAMKGTPAARPGLAVMQKGLQRQREAFPGPVRVRASRPAPGTAPRGVVLLPRFSPGPVHPPPPDVQQIGHASTIAAWKAERGVACVGGDDLGQRVRGARHRGPWLRKCHEFETDLGGRR